LKPFQEATVKHLGKSVSIEESHPDEHDHAAAGAGAAATAAAAVPYDDDDDDEFSEGLTARQKTALGFIW
jgi:hypothetical protein